MLPLQRPIKNRKNELETTVLREFDGGWNVLDNDLSLSTKFSKILENVSRRDDGSMEVRWGTRLFADINTSTIGNIIAMEYFQNNIIVVVSTGELFYVNSSGTASDLWTATIATWQGAAAWGATDFASFIAFNGELVVCNGVDKPLVIDLNQAEPQNKCQYLQDLGVGSNANTPIGRYVTVANDYVVIAGDVLNPGRIHISNSGTSGTWYGDAAPNDGLYVDIDRKVNTNTGIINGISFYKNRLIILFDEIIVAGKLGAYNASGAHVPTFDDVYYAHGGIAHRSIQHIGDDLLLCDNIGTPSLKQNTFVDTISPYRPSELIDDAIQSNLSQLTVGTITKDIWALYNQLEQQYMLFIPNHENNVQVLSEDPFVVGDINNNIIIVTMIDHILSEEDQITFSAATGFNTITAGMLNTTHNIYTIIDDDTFTINITGVTLNPLLRIYGGGLVVSATVPRTQSTGYIMNKLAKNKTTGAWTKLVGWNFSSGCKSLLGRLFLSEQSGTKIYIYGTKQDRINQDFIGDVPTPINWIFEFPWTALKRRMNTKKFRYIGFDTRGDARFKAMMFIDDIYKDSLGRRIPDLEAEFLGGDAYGFGHGTQSYGGGRRSDSELLFNWTTKGKIVKLRLEGTTTKPLRIIAIMFAFLFGSIRR